MAMINKIICSDPKETEKNEENRFCFLVAIKALDKKNNKNRN